MIDPKWSTIIPLIGGSAVGCSQATKNKPQFHVSYSAFDSNEKHILNYWPEVPRYVLDRNENPPSIDLDFVNSVCPCAGLSQLNTSKDESTRDEKNRWMFESAEYVLQNLKPKVFFGENAPGLYTNSGKRVLDRLIELGQNHSYSFSLYRTNTMFHGIPQRRIRTFYFYWRDRNSPILRRFNRFSKPFHEYILEVPKSALNQDQLLIKSATGQYKSYEFLLKKLNTTHQDFIKLHDEGAIHSVYTYLHENNLLCECISYLKEHHPDSKEISRLENILQKTNSGGRFMDGSPGFYYNRTNAIVGRTLTGLLHPHEDRGVSVRECLHMMGLPHDFPFTNLKDLNHIAQNVPTCTARDMASQVLQYLEGDLQDSGSKVLKQCNITGEVEF